MYLTLAGSTASVGDLDGVLGLSDILATSGQTVNLELHYSSNGGIDFSGGGLITGILWGLTVDLLDGAEVLDGSITTGAVGANIVVGVTEIYTSAMHFTWVAPTGLNDGDLLISFSFLTGVVETLAGNDVGDFAVAGFAPVLGIAPTVFDPITTAFTSAVTYDLQTGAIADVPLPASALLLLGALGGLAGVRRMRRV